MDTEYDSGLMWCYSIFLAVKMSTNPRLSLGPTSETPSADLRPIGCLISQGSSGRWGLISATVVFLFNQQESHNGASLGRALK